jgi:hypothetical protein
MHRAADTVCHCDDDQCSRLTPVYDKSSAVLSTDCRGRRKRSGDHDMRREVYNLALH